MATNNRFKILIISPEYPPLNTGGGGTAYQSFIEELSKHNHDLTVISGNHTDTSSESKPYSEVINNIQITRLPLNKPILRVLNAKTYPNNNSKNYLKNLLNENKFDFALIYGAFEGLSVYSSKLLSESKIPYFLYAHGYPNLKNFNPLIRIIFKIYEKFVLIPMFKSAKKVFSVNPQKALPVATEYLPNGISSDFTKIQQVIDIRGKYNIPKDNLIAFSLGRLHKNKGFQYAIEAIKKFPNITYIIGGKDDGYEKELREMSNGISNIVFAGGLNNEEKKSYYLASDLYISPSLEEFFGISMLEALTFNVPLICTPLGIAYEEIVEKQNGFIIKTRSSKSIEDVLEDITNNPKILEKVKSNMKYIPNEYHWKRIVEEFLNKVSEEINEKSL